VALATSGASAQQTSPSGTNISTGSGAGTGTMAPMSPSQTQLPDMNTPLGPGRGGGPGDRRVPPIDPRLPRDPADMPDGPDDLLSIPRFPDEDTGPILGIPSPFGGYGARAATPEQIRAIEARLIEDARAIADPADRSLAFDRTAQAMILADHWASAQQALAEGGEAALRIEENVRHDVRLQGLVSTSLTLAEELTREATVSNTYASIEITQSSNGRSIEDRVKDLTAARQVIALASRLAAGIRNDNFSAYAMAQVAEAQANNSATVAVFAANPAAVGESGSESGPIRINAEADAMLREARDVARAIALPVWRDQTLVRVVSAADGGALFNEGSEIARSIRNPEARSDAQIRVAEAMARHGLQAPATAEYQEALTSILSIPLEDPRQTLGAVLLDSLLAVGRFEDARLTSSLILKPDIRMIALGAIAKSMGERGLADEAIDWIDREVEPAMRDRMRREVNEGLVIWLQQNRATPGGLRAIPDIFTPGELENVLPQPRGGEAR
jgi:hypothetical protein